MDKKKAFFHDGKRQRLTRRNDQKESDEYHQEMHRGETAVILAGIAVDVEFIVKE
ncbi:MAG: hypothetical protein IKG97_02010 [Lachnospiraceae bacterium]|nr:hypothetical protein [Lachnospiraceae bacterium]